MDIDAESWNWPEPTAESHLVEPFDISMEAPSMTTTTHPMQEETRQAAIVGTFDDGNHDFDSQHIQTRRLDILKKGYETPKREDCVPRIGHRAKIAWKDSQYVVPSTDKDIHWKADGLHLDLIICRGRTEGIAVVIPNVDDNHAMEFNMELKCSPRTFNAKFAHLGFDPAGAMHYIGRTHRSEEAWMALIPEDAVGDLLEYQEPIAPGTCSGSTRMSERHYLGSYIYLAGELSAVCHRDIVVWDKYPDLDDKKAVLEATNLK